MATNWSVCGICDFRKITKPSVVWCSECDEGLCEDCKEHHSVSKASRNHDTVSIDKYQKLPCDILQTVQSCVEHNEKYHIYCQKHDCPCCKICIVEKHSKCKDLKDINDVIKNVKSSVGFIELENTLSEVAENIRRIRKDREVNLSSLTKDKKRIFQDIKQVRAAVDKHFDNLQEQAIKELQTAAEAESKKIQNILSMVEQQEKIIKECLSNLSSIKQYASDLQTFLAMKQIEIDVKDNVKSIQSFSKSNDLKKTTIFFTADSTIKDLSNRFQNIGEIVIETNPTGISFVRRKEKQAQVMISLQTKSIDSLRLTLEQTVKTNRQSDTGCVYLPSGKMVFSSYTFGKNGGLLILNSNGSKDFQIEPPAAPFDVVYNEKDHTLIATTTTYMHMIHVDIENKTTKEIVDLKTECSGLDIGKPCILFW